MATYEYKCPECGDIKVISHSVHDTSVYHCDKCVKEMRKVFHVPGTVFPGTGWGKDAR